MKLMVSKWKITIILSHEAGITYELKGTTDKPVSLNVSTDVDAIFDKIKQFVDKYNELVELVNGKVNEKRNRDYQPLTAEEKKPCLKKKLSYGKQQLNRAC